MVDDDNADLLKILESHGQSFLASFGSLEPIQPSKKRKLDVDTQSSKKPKSLDKPDESEEEEWHGIEGDYSDDSSEGEESEVSDQEGLGNEQDLDDEFTAESSSNVVVFSDSTLKGTRIVDPASKAQMKAFMSSKTSKVSALTEGSSSNKSSKPEENEDERTNLQNDALLHKLVHTKLLSGSMNTELDLSPAQRRKALAGRILELTGDVKMGKGEREVRTTERNKAAKRVREGIAHKQKERSKQELEEAKNLGNYHQSLKKVFEASSSSTPSNRKRQKGLGMGVGKFSDGLLRLSRADATKAMAGPEGGFSRRGGANRGRGRGRGRPAKRN